MTSSLERAAPRLPTLTGMRFLCAAMVFGIHAALMGFFSSAETGATFTAAVTQGGFVGVAYFFLLSGFVLTWSARPGDRLGAFWRRRFVKIYPSYLVALLLGIALTVAVQGMVFDRRPAVLDLLLVQSWSPDIQTRSSFNGPLWSLSAEAAFYLCFPLLLGLVNRIRPERLWAWFAGLVAVVVAVPVVVGFLPQGEPFPVFGATTTEMWIAFQLPATRMLDFALGIVLARIVLTHRRLPIGLGGAVALAVSAYWLTQFVPVRFAMAAVMVVPLALVIAAAATQDSAGRPSWISGRVWVWLGEISYAFYLLHFLVLMYTVHLLGGRTLGSAAAFGLIALLFAVTVVLSALLHHLVERPMMKHFSRSRRDRAERPAPVGLPTPDVAADASRREAA